jgi:hypothetical protein
VGNHSLDILEAMVTTSGPPSSLSDPGNFTVENTGTLTVSNARATATELIGAETIPADASVFSPAPVGSLVTGQTRTVTWEVNVPANTLAGTYNGTITVWNDSNNNGLIDAGEAFTDAPAEFEVTAKRIIEVLPDVLDLGWATENSTTEGTIEIINRGNVILTDLTGLSSTITNAAMDTISNITFIPDPIGTLDIGDSFIATVSVTVGAPQSTGVYSGDQRVYDDYQAPSGSYTVDEESDTFELRISIGRKDVDVDPLVEFGSNDPGQTVSSLLFTATNLTVIPLSRLKWFKADLSNGTDIIPVASFTFTPPVLPDTYFGLGSAASNNSCQGELTIGAYAPPGTYYGEQTLWEDDNGNNIIDPKEASATFIASITINPVNDLDIVPAVVDLGTVEAGQSSAMIDVDITNNGNTVLNSLTWSFQNLYHVPDGDEINSSYLGAANIPATLNPGETATIQLYLDTTSHPSPGDLKAGVYESNNNMLNGPGGANDICDIVVEIIAADDNPFGEGSVYQEIPSDKFPDSASGDSTERYIYSAWVNPGIGSAAIEFHTLDSSDALSRFVGVYIDKDGNISINQNPGGQIVNQGYTDVIPKIHPEHPAQEHNWYRIFVAFDFAFDSGAEAGVCLVLKNTSSVAGTSVWFDGVQLEKGIYDDQEEPTAYGSKNKIVSPNKNYDIQGNRRFFSW